MCKLTVSLCMLYYLMYVYMYVDENDPVESEMQES